MIPPIVYQDGVRIMAAGNSYREMRYGISRPPFTVDADLILSQDEALELAAALTWIISEVDAKNGRESFKIVVDRRRWPR